MAVPYEFELRFDKDATEYEKKALLSIVESYIKQSGGRKWHITYPSAARSARIFLLHRAQAVGIDKKAARL